MSNYEAPAELRGLEKGLLKLCAKGKHEMSRVFEDWLRFIVANFTLNIEPDKSWSYTRDEDKQFHELMAEWFLVMQRQTITEKWYDAFGELYMSLIASKSTQQGNGQFFTPPHICDLMQAVTGQAGKVEGITVSDPTCGSGRLLLAFHAENLGNYLMAEDISQVCCLMTVCNFLIHGCDGEVVWHDSIDPDSWYGGWAVKKPTIRLPLPHVIEIEKSQSVLMKLRAEDRQEKKTEQPPKMITIAKPIQLDLFAF